MIVFEYFVIVWRIDSVELRDTVKEITEEEVLEYSIV
jgi:hypothetical protein